MTDLPRITSQATRERVESILVQECGGYLCEGSPNPPFVRRRTANGVVTVHIQCDKCGRSRSGALKRADFPYWQDFREWDEERVERHRRRINEHLDTKREQLRQEFPTLEQQAEQREERREIYREWLATSVEWKTIRARVLARANRVCEACLAAPASDVHHLTYQRGWLPPAWELRAVCRPCHDRLHDWTGGDE